jgi:hypothetical protein
VASLKSRTRPFKEKASYPLLENPKAVIRETVFAEHHWHDFDDHGRSARSDRYKYIRNFYPDVPGNAAADAVRSLHVSGYAPPAGCGQAFVATAGLLSKPAAIRGVV